MTIEEEDLQVSLCGLVYVVCVQPHNANHKRVICQDNPQVLCVCLDPVLNISRLFVELARVLAS